MILFLYSMNKVSKKSLSLMCSILTLLSLVMLGIVDINATIFSHSGILLNDVIIMDKF